MSQKDKRKPEMVAAECIGIAHLIVANLIVVIGQKTNIIRDIMTEDPNERIVFPGFEFIYRYVDFPVFHLVKGINIPYTYDIYYAISFGELVIVSSTILYSAIAYFCISIFGLLFEE